MVVVADDPSAISSSNEEDSRFAAALAHIPLLEPATPQEALDMTRFAFDLSERIGNICLVRSVSRLSHTRSNVRLGEPPSSKPRPWFNTSVSFHTFPVVARHQAMYEKLDRARETSQASLFHPYQGPEDAEFLILACGPAWLYAREALDMMNLGGEIGLLKIGVTWPLPDDVILKRLKPAREVLIVEEIDPILERHVKALAADHGPTIGLKKFYGKASGHIPRVGEVTPDTVMNALGRITGRPGPRHRAGLPQPRRSSGPGAFPRPGNSVFVPDARTEPPSGPSKTSWLRTTGWIRLRGHRLLHHGHLAHRVRHGEKRARHGLGRGHVLRFRQAPDPGF